MSKLIPILFSTPMVQALLEGNKTMTRRSIKLQPSEKATEVLPTSGWGIKDFAARFECLNKNGKVFYEITNLYKCPYGKVGDILWVRETWLYNDSIKQPYAYKADFVEDVEDRYKGSWKPSIFMPKDACRIFLKITNIRVERLQDINEDDAMAEGINLVEYNCFENYLVDTDWIFRGINQKNYHMYEDPIGSIASLWAKINGPESWDLNPWVWVIEFEKTEKPTL